MFRATNNSITMINGDTADITIVVEDYVAAENDKLYFGVKNNINAVDYVLFKEVGYESLQPGTNNTFIVSITSDESNSMGIGTFTYDVQLERPDYNSVDTIIWPSSFTIQKGVVEKKVNKEGVE